MNPHDVHEVLAIGTFIVLPPACILALLYNIALQKFFRELEVKERELWEQIGQPGFRNMMAVPLGRFRTYAAFLPVLRQRARDPASGYRHARSAYLLLLSTAWAMGLVFGLVGFMTAWMFWHGL